MINQQIIILLCGFINKIQIAETIKSSPTNVIPRLQTSDRTSYPRLDARGSILSGYTNTKEKSFKISYITYKFFFLETLIANKSLYFV